MSDLHKILQEEYEKKLTLSPHLLMEMIGEMMDEMTAHALSPSPIEEEASNQSTRTYHVSEIPMIPISELGWANADDDAANDDPSVPPSQRAGLEQYLRNIPGTGFDDKLNAVSDIMKEGINSLPKDNPREFIQQAMAFLVFYKTLTMAITNFNASAAGFNFEAFLAALMDGKQIPASGANTIADITANVDGERVPISLKLYNDAGLEVGGSFVDLSNDMIVPNPAWEAWVASNPEFEGGAMRYIACTKQLSGEGVEQEGVINFYEFDITRSNLFELLSNAGQKGQKCILSNRAFMSALTRYMETGEETEALEWAANIPARSDTSDSAEMSTMWSNWLDKTPLEGLQEFGVDDSQIEAIKDAILRLYIDTIEREQKALRLGTPSQIKGAILSVINPELKTSSRHPDVEKTKQIAALFIDLFNQFKKQEIKSRDARTNFLNSVEEWVTGNEVVEWYNALTPELKAVAIKNSRGYLSNSHWVVPRGATIRLGGGEPFAMLQIGAKYVVQVLETARGELIDEVFGIFDEMAKMSAKLNSFFANGLRAPEEAEAGAEAGEAAAEKARHVAGVDE